MKRITTSIYLQCYKVATAVASLRLRLLCAALLSFFSACYVHAANNLTSVDQIEEGKCYAIRFISGSSTYYDLGCNNFRQILYLYPEGIGPSNYGNENWMFEKTDDGHYYLHNLFGIYLSVYNDDCYSGVISGTKAEATKLNVSYSNGAFHLQKASDSTYLMLSTAFTTEYYKKACWNEGYGSDFVISEIEPSTETGHMPSEYTICQLQEGEKIDLLPMWGDQMFLYQWKSNNENVATVDSCGMVRALKEGMTVITLTNKVTGESAFTHVTVKNNPSEHEYDPYHDIMIKYTAVSGSQMLFGSGYNKFYAKNDFDIYIDGVKTDPDPNRNGLYLDAFSVFQQDFDYCGIHTVVIVPSDPYSYFTIPDSMFCERIDVNYESAGIHYFDIYHGGSIVELRLPNTIKKIGNYNGYFCPNLRDIYFYNDPESFLYSLAAFLSEETFYNYNDFTYCGSTVCGEKNFYVKSDIPDNMITNYENDWDVLYRLYGGCGFQMKSMDNPDQKVWIACKDQKILLGDSGYLYAAHIPDYIDLKYTAGDESILSCDSLGHFTAVKVGKTTVTVSAADGSPAVKTFEVEVVDDLSPIKVDTIIVSPSELTLNANQMATLSVTCLPENAARRSVTWSSSDNSVAMASNGVVVALAEGTATITATADDGGGATGECKVTVLKDETGIDNMNGEGQVKIILADNRLSITGLANNVPISVSSVQGYLVYQGTEHTCTLPGAGLYIVKVQGTTFKISIK